MVTNLDKGAAVCECLRGMKKKGGKRIFEERKGNALLAHVVPYAVEEGGRERPFSREMEKAAVYCLVEARRKKPGILRGTVEHIDYIAKLCYPLYGVPWRGRCMIVDGLGLSSITILHKKIPDVTRFTEDLLRSSFSFSSFQVTLKSHERTFGAFPSVEEQTLEALFGQDSVLKALQSLLNQAEGIREWPEQDVTLIPPTFPQDEAIQKAQSLIQEWQRLHNEVEALQYAFETLRTEAKYHGEKIAMEIEQIWKDYESRITEMRKLVDRRVKRHAVEKEKKMERAAKLTSERIKGVLKERRRLEQMIEKQRDFVEELQRKRKKQKRRYPKRSTDALDRRILARKKQVGGLMSEVQDLIDLEKVVRREGDENLKETEKEYFRLAAEELEKLKILEQSRNLETSEKREVELYIEETSSAIATQIEQLIEEKTGSTENLEGKALPFDVEETVLIGIPFYISQYKTTEKIRTDVCPLVTAASYNRITEKVQGAGLSFSLEARIQLLLNQRSPVLNEAVFAKLKRALRTSPALQERFSEIGRSVNLLAMPSFSEEVARGLSELEAEGWLNPKEKDTILSAFAQYEARHD